MPARGAILVLLIAALAVALPARADDGPDEVRTGGLLRVHWDYPAKASLGFGVVVGKLPEDFDCKTTCLFRGASFQAAAGLGGGEVAVGWASMVAETGRGAWLLRHVYMGYGVRAAVVRTWGSSTLEPDGATFAGVEGGFTVAQFGLRLGIFRHLDPGPGESDWRIFGGIGWGF